MDGDGIGELRKIIVGGSGYNNYIVLENEVINKLPFAMCVAIPMPFRFFGLSMYDLLADVQMMSTTIMRNTLIICIFKITQEQSWLMDKQT